MKKQVLTKLNDAIKDASDLGLFDILVAHCRNPDSINDFCDAVNYELETKGNIDELGTQKG
jgi:hypothetical protein